MTRGGQLARTALATVVAGAMLLLVAVAATAAPSGWTASRHLTSLSVAGDVGGVVLLGAGAGSIALLVWVLWPDARRRERAEGTGRRLRPQRWWRRLLGAVLPVLPGLALVGLLALVLLGHHHHARHVTAGAGALAGRAALGGRAGQAHAHVAAGSGAVVGLGAAGVVALLGALAAVLWYRRRSARRLAPTSAEPPPSEAPLETVAARALGELDRERDPRRAILAAYRALEDGLVVPSARRVPSEAPLEFRDRLVAAGAPADAAAALTDLFELARFSDHPIGAAEREEAEAALRALRGIEVAAP